MQNNFYPTANGMYGGNGYYNPYGYNNNMYHTYGQPAVKMPNNQTLTQEQQDYLMNNGGNLDLSIDPDTMLRAGCTHRDVRTGDIAFTINPETKRCHCAICGAEWNMFEDGIDGAQQCVDRLNDIIQTIKVSYPDASDAVLVKFLKPMDPLTKKIPMVLEHAMRSFAKYEDINQPGVNRISMADKNVFNTYNTMAFTGGYPQGFNPMMGQGGMVNPYAGQPGMPNPQANPNPMMGQGGMVNPYAGQPNMGNPMMGGYPMGAVDPNNNPMGFVAPSAGMMPGAAPAAATVTPPAAPAATGEVTQQKVYNV